MTIETAGVNARVERLLRHSRALPVEVEPRARCTLADLPRVVRDRRPCPGPGGAISAFCEPETTASSPHSSVSQGTAPRLEIASTAIERARLLAQPRQTRERRRRRPSRSRTASRARPCAPPARTGARRDPPATASRPTRSGCGRPRSRRRARCRPSARRSSRPRRRRRGSPGDVEVRDDRLEPRRPRAPCRAAPRSAFGRPPGAGRGTRVDRPEVGAAVVDDRPRHRREHFRRDRRRPGRDQIRFSAKPREPSSSLRLRPWRLSSRSRAALLALRLRALPRRGAGAERRATGARRAGGRRSSPTRSPPPRSPGERPRAGTRARSASTTCSAALLTAPLLGVGSLLLHGWRRCCARRSSTSGSRSESRSRFRCTEPSATSIPAAQDHLDLHPRQARGDRGERHGNVGRRRLSQSSRSGAGLWATR